MIARLDLHYMVVKIVTEVSMKGEEDAKMHSY